jgi:lipopolysaccharide/colanic/teichoic acid biosynthesis glycosyltransferase
MFKRIFDVLVSFVSLVILAIPLLFISLLIFLNMGSPVLFVQVRPGKNGIPFKILKFRTMRNAKSKFGRMMPDEMRITRFGGFLRKSSLDELPELWNVFTGDMSLVGPRPLLMEYLPLYSEIQRRRHEVRPGITGLAQINGRNAISWEKKFAYDVWYVDNKNLWLDLKIILSTFRRVVLGEGVSAIGEATVRKFTGDEKR